ncbi:MAG: hypothetical protein IKI26_09950 [Prevotella sp.]|nr:hypothetical protein [Prevotella sp.]
MHYYWPILASKLLILTTTILAQQHVFAQGRCVIVDKETGTPIRDVKAYTDKEEEFTTDYRGVLVIDKPFDSATLAHPKFLSRKVGRTELKDTVWLLPKAIRLDEVVVWGVKRSPMDAMMGSIQAQLAAEAAMHPPVVGFDFFQMFRKKPLNKKARKKNEKLLKEWDEVYGKK